MSAENATSWDKVNSETRGKASGPGAERTDTEPRNAVTEEGKAKNQNSLLDNTSTVFYKLQLRRLHGFLPLAQDCIVRIKNGIELTV